MTRRRHSPVMAATIVLAGVMASHALLETARDAMFLARLGPDRLAWAYLVIAGASLLAFAALRRLLGLRDARRLLLTLLVTAAVGTAILAATIASSRSIVFVLYVWTGLIATLVVPCFWTVVDRSLSVGEAKRFFTMIGAGGIAGALVGSASAAILGRLTAPRHLVTAGAIAFAITTVTAAILAPRSRRDVALVRRARARRTMPRRTYRYIRLLAMTTLVATVALTLGDLAFKRAVSDHLAADELATTFGTIYTGLNVVSLGVQLVVAPRILDRLGVGAAMTILPALLLLSALGFALTATLGAIIALKVGDGSLRHSLHRVTSELLYLPMAAPIRDGAKPIADAVGQRGGQVVAVLVVLSAPLLGLETGARFLSIIAAAAALVWLGLVPTVRAAYIDQFRGMLATSANHAARPLRLDATAVATLQRTLASPSETEALAALELLAAHGVAVPVLALYHPRAAVVRRGLELLGGARYPEIATIVDHLVEHADSEIRAAALAVSRRAARDDRQLERALADPHPRVRATAAVVLAQDPARARMVAACVADLVVGSADDRSALARAFSRAPSEEWRATLAELLARREPEVVREVLAVYARAPALGDLERLLPLLEDFRVRDEARRVFVAAGERGLAVLVAALADPVTPVAVRRHIPRSLSPFSSPAAASALVARLPHEPDGTTELKLLRALGRMRDDDPALAIDREALRSYLRRAVAAAARFVTLLDHLRARTGTATAASALLVELLDERKASAIENAFRTLGILHPTAGLRRVHDALVGTDDERRVAAREIAEGVIDLRLRTALFAAVDDLAADERRKRLGELAPGPFPTTASFITELLSDTSESLRSLATAYATERGLDGALRNVCG